MEHYGLVSVVPVLIVVITAFITRRTVEPMLLGGIIGFIIVSGKGFFTSSIDAMYTVLGDPVTIWVVMLVFLFGSMVALFERSRSTERFGTMVAKIATSKKKSLFLTWILGLVVFADDYLNVLSVGVTMRNVTDKYNISREYLAYVVASAGAGICVIIPFTSWSAYMMGLMGNTGVIDKADAFSTYVGSIPFLFYAWISYLIVPFVILKIVPLIGPIKKAEKRAIETGQTFPDSTVEIYTKDIVEISEEDEPKKANAFTFFLPLLVLAGVTIWSGDILIGVIVALVLTIIMVAVQRIMKASELCDTCIEGMKDMLLPNFIIVAAFFLQQANAQLGLTEFVIESTEPILSPAIFPAIVFIVVSVLAFGTGSFWGLAAIAFPIILPLAQALDVSIFLACGALISGTVFGSKACFFSDAATLVSVATQIKNADFARNVLPQILIPFVISIIVFFAVGIVMA